MHGGRLEAARRRFPGAPEPFLDLSTGINPVPYPPPPLAVEAFTRLPEPEALAALLEAAADAYGATEPAMVAAAPGSQALIGLLPRLRPPGRVRVLGPTYAEHARAWAQADHTVDEVATLDALAGAEVAVLSHPNNPDGRRYDQAALLGLAAAQAARGGWLVVDEAFADLEPGAPGLGTALPRPGLVLLRSFGKTYGLAGLRLGFALAAPDLAERIAEALGPWPVSGPAIAIGAAALRDCAWREASAVRLARDAARLDALLGEVGLAVIGGTLLFRLARVADAATLAERLGRAGILVRVFPERPDWLRFGLPPDASAWHRLAAALEGRDAARQG